MGTMDPPSHDRFLPLLLWGLWTPVSVAYASSISSLLSRDRAALAVSMAATEEQAVARLEAVYKCGIHSALPDLCGFLSLGGVQVMSCESEMSQLERSIDTIINTFHHYSVRMGHPDTLSQKELKQLVQKELPNFLKREARDEKAIKEIMEDLDTNQDKQLSFEEFVILVARLVHASHEEMHKNAPPGHEGHSHGPGLGGGGHGHGHSHGHGHGHSH